MCVYVYYIILYKPHVFEAMFPMSPAMWQYGQQVLDFCEIQFKDEESRNLDF